MLCLLNILSLYLKSYIKQQFLVLRKSKNNVQFIQVGTIFIEYKTNTKYSISFK